MIKPRVAKRGGRWAVQWPGYGFSRGSVKRHASFDEALRASQRRIHSSGGDFERAEEVADDPHGRL